MGKRYLIDTNVVLDFMGNKLTTKAREYLSQIIDNELNISVINKIELLGFTVVEQDLVDFVNCSNVYPIDDGIVETVIELRKKHKIKLPDCIIAATALFNKFTIITSNTKDFHSIRELDILHPNDL